MMNSRNRKPAIMKINTIVLVIAVFFYWSSIFGQVSPFKSPSTPHEKQVYLNYIKTHLSSEDVVVYIQRFLEEDILSGKDSENWDPVIDKINIFKNMAIKVGDSSSVLEFLDSLDAIVRRDENPINIRVINKNSVNSKKDEYAPCLSMDGKTLYFTRSGKEGLFSGEDIFISNWDARGRKWGRASKLGSPVNTESENESIISISSDEKSMLLYQTDPNRSKGDIYTSSINQETNWWSKPEPLSNTINSDDWEGSGFLSADGRYLLFSSSKRNMTGPYAPKGSEYHGDKWGNIDIYLSERINGTWSTPVPLNSNINTPYADMSPYLSADGMILYFSSDGHPGFGRLDVFISTREDPGDWNSWGKPRNLGKYINSPWNDWDYIIPNNGDRAFFAQERDMTGVFSRGAKQYDIVVGELPEFAQPPCTEEVRIPIEEHERFKEQSLNADIKPVEVELVDPGTRKRIVQTSVLPGDTAVFFVACNQAYEVEITSEHLAVNKVPPVPPRTKPDLKPEEEKEKIEQSKKRKKAEQEQQQELKEDIEEIEKKAREQLSQEKKAAEEDSNKELAEEENEIEKDAEEKLETQKENLKKEADEQLAEQKRKAKEHFDESMTEPEKQKVDEALEKQSKDELSKNNDDAERDSDSKTQKALAEAKQKADKQLQDENEALEKESMEDLEEKIQAKEEDSKEHIAADTWEGPEEYIDPARTKPNETRKTVGPSAESPVSENVFIKNPFERDDSEEWKQIDKEARKDAPILPAVDSMLANHNPSDTLLLDWPVRSVKEQNQAFPSDALPDTAFWAVSAYYDHDSLAPGFLRDWNNGSITYDLADGYSHAGTDIMAFPFSWERFEHNEIEIIAAADGVIISIVDGEGDRNCEIDRAYRANSVGLMHSDGTTTWYGHLKTGSTVHNTVGDFVKAGHYLGLMGSSGASTGPHLHFGIKRADGKDVDPYKGPGSSSKRSMWRKQKAYRNSAVSAIFTHAYMPQLSSCGVSENTYKSTEYSPGDEVIIGIYLRDVLSEDVIKYTLLNPGGELVSSGEHINENTLSLSTVFWKYGLPNKAKTGLWKIQIEYSGKMHFAYFNVSDDREWKKSLPLITDTEATGPTRVEHDPVVVIESDKLNKPLKGDKICFETWAIKFEFNSAQLTQQDKLKIDEFYDKIMQYPGRAIEITGHTDPVGSAAYNKILGQKRADSIKAYFIQKGTDELFIQTRSMGEEQPLFLNGVINNEMSRRVGICILN